MGAGHHHARRVRGADLADHVRRRAAWRRRVDRDAGALAPPARRRRSAPTASPGSRRPGAQRAGDRPRAVVDDQHRRGAGRCALSALSRKKQSPRRDERDLARAAGPRSRRRAAEPDGAHAPRARPPGENWSVRIAAPRARRRRPAAARARGRTAPEALRAHAVAAPRAAARCSRRSRLAGRAGRPRATVRGRDPRSARRCSTSPGARVAVGSAGDASSRWFAATTPRSPRTRSRTAGDPTSAAHPQDAPRVGLRKRDKIAEMRSLTVTLLVGAALAAGPPAAIAGGPTSRPPASCDGAVRAGAGRRARPRAPARPTARRSCSPLSCSRARWPPATSPARRAGARAGPEPARRRRGARTGCRAVSA